MEEKKILDKLIEPIILVDKNFNITYVNDSSSKFFNKKKQDMMNRKCYEIIHATKELPKECMACKILETNKACSGEFYNSEIKKYLSLKTIPILNEKQVEEIIHCVKDVTEEKKAEGALKDEKNFTESIIKSLPGIFYVFDEEQKIIKWNKNSEKVLGVFPEEMGNIHLMDPIENKDKERVREAVKKAIIEGRSEVETNLVSKNGKSTPFLFAAAAMEKDGKKYLVGSGFDMTEKNKAENALKESEEEYRLLFDNMLSGFALHKIITDKKGKPIDYSFIKINDSFERLTGLKRENIINKKVTEILPGIENDSANWINKYGKVALTGKQIQFENYSHSLKKWYSVTAYCPKKEYFAVIFNDITEKKKIQEQKIKNLKELDEAKTNFLNIISHELKTPLTAIFAHLDVLDDLKSQHSDESSKSLDAIKRNSKHLKVLIENILEISRIESEKFELNLDEVDINYLVEKLVGNLKILSDKKNLGLITEIEELPKIIADSERIEGVLYNLIHNAIKFTEEGLIKIIAKKQGEDILIQIKDTGVGMSDREMEKLFQKFYQIDPSISRRHGGTGIGLSITKQLIKLHGGEISVESKLGEGSTFSFLLPIKQKEVKNEKNSLY